MIIGIDAASTDLSLALAEPDGAVIEEVAWTTAQRQSAEILPRLLELMERNGRGWDRVSAIVVGTGPGSFTGLRVAMALAKGLAVALERPIVGVPSLEAWLEAQVDAVAAIARAGAREAYMLTRDASAPVIVDRDALPQVAMVAPAELAVAFGLADARQPRAAGVMSRRAAARLAADPGGDDVRTIEPIYLRAPRGMTTANEGQVKWL
ncbi:MAG: tRNA (adenosine(37)-N6)-threonylcarbamoyltransferase complex dimerization subunit type 1 TsaB [Chloroflexi bacterium]|nr:tRNA (adenosine(37)-N6)-threonylcarbamoyltransferase complex dimerization subunit type 1 TsaB [Chloroflexota bacterium]